MEASEEPPSPVSHENRKAVGSVQLAVCGVQWAVCGVQYSVGSVLLWVGSVQSLGAAPRYICATQTLIRSPIPYLRRRFAA